MNKRWVKGGILLTACLFLVGCGNVSKSLDGGSSESGSGSYSGNSTLSGTVTVSEADSAKIGQTLSPQSFKTQSTLSTMSRVELQGILRPTALASGVAYVYAIQSDGSKVFVTSANVVDGHYSVGHLKDGVKYVVSVRSVGVDSLGAANELIMDSFVDLKTGATEATSNVSSKTSLISSYLVENVVKQGGVSFGDTVSTQLVTKAQDAINSGLSDGSIQQTSCVRSVTSNVQVGTSTYQTPPNVSTAVLETIANDDGVLKVTQQAAFESKLKSTSLTLDQAKAIIRGIFGGSDVKDTKQTASGGGGIPDFFVDQLAQAFVSGKMVTIDQFATAFNDSLPEGAVKSTYWTKANVAALLKAVCERQSPEHAGVVKELYEYYDGEPDSANLTPIIKAVFPRERRLTLPVTDQTQLNVPQALVLMKACALMDSSSLPDDVRRSFGDGPVFNPITFMKAIQFMTIESGRYYVVEKRISPVKTYKQVGDNWQQVDALDSSVVVYTEGSVRPIGRIVLKYPKLTGGTGSVDYSVIDNPFSSGGASVQTLSVSSTSGSSGSVIGKLVAMVQNKLTAMGVLKYNGSLKPQTAEANPFDKQYRIAPWGNSPTYVSDFKSGECTIEVYDNVNQKVAESTITIFKFDIGTIQWISPKGMDMDKVQAGGWDENFEPDTLPVDENNVARPVLSWSAPSVTLPDGYELVYGVDLGISAVKVDWQNQTFQPEHHYEGPWDQQGEGYAWKRIWSSWSENRLIRSNSLPLKFSLIPSVVNNGKNFTTTYEVNVTPLVIESASGRVVWQGTPSRTSFKVGNASPWSFSLSGRVRFNSRVLSMMTNQGFTGGTWKIGLFRLGGNSNGSWVDSFFGGQAGGRSPVTAGDTPVVASLGSMQDAISAGDSGLSYSLPTISKTSNTLLKFNNYKVIVWYDVSTAPSTPDWTIYGSATSGQIDFSPGRFLEYFEMSDSDIWVDQMGPRLNSWKENTSKLLISAPSTEVNVSVGQYF